MPSSARSPVPGDRRPDQRRRGSSWRVPLQESKSVPLRVKRPGHERTAPEKVQSREGGWGSGVLELVLDQPAAAAEDPADDELELPEHLRKFPEGDVERIGGGVPGGEAPPEHRPAHPPEEEGICEEQRRTDPARRPRETEGEQRHEQAPKPVAPRLADPVALRRLPVQGRALRVSVAPPDVPLPPLAEAGHVGVVQRHLRVHAQDLPPFLSQADAELGLLSRDQVRRESADLLEGRDAHLGVAAAGLRRAHRRVPLHVAKPVVDRRPGAALAAAAADDAQLRIRRQLALGPLHPGRRDLAVAVGELHELHPRVQRGEPLEARVAGPCGREGESHVEFDDLDALRARPRDAAVARSGVDVDDGPPAPDDRGQASLQPVPLVASDRHDADPRHGLTPAGARIFAGIPTALAPSGTSMSTTAFAPTAASSPIRTAPRILAPAPTLTRWPRTGASAGRSRLRLPRVQPWRMMLPSPMTQLPWMTMPDWCSKTTRRPSFTVHGSSMP